MTYVVLILCLLNLFLSLTAINAVAVVGIRARVLPEYDEQMAATARPAGRFIRWVRNVVRALRGAE